MRSKGLDNSYRLRQYEWPESVRVDVIFYDIGFSSRHESASMI